MTALLASVILATSPGAPPNPLPDGKSIDSFMYRFSADPFLLGPLGHFSVSANGKVNYSHLTKPSTGSGGIVTQKSWTLTKDETAELFRNLVADGLLEIPDAKGPPLGNHKITVSSGRWQFTITPEKVPDKVMKHLRPLLAKAHPALWGEKVEPKPELPKQPVFTSFQYTFTPKVDGEFGALTVYRDGTVRYTRQMHPTAPGGRKVLVNEQWKIPAKDAAVLIDSLLADGLFDLADTGGGVFPNHYITAQAGRWHTSSHPKEMPEKLAKHFRPLLLKVDADFWK